MGLKTFSLVVDDLEELSDAIYQIDNAIPNYKFANECVKTMVENMQAIYDWIDCHEIEDNNFDLYVLGDAINLLQSIKIKKEK